MAGLDGASLLSSDDAGGVLLRTRADVFHLARSARAWTREAGPSGAQAPAAGYRPRVMATTPGNFVYSTGGEWREATRLPDGVVPQVIVAAGPPGTLFASSGGILSAVLKNSGIWRSDDNGRTWQLAHRPNIGNAGNCCGLVVDPHDRNTIYLTLRNVGIGGGGSVVRRTTDAGVTWTELKLPGLALAFELVPTAPTTIIGQLYGGGLVRSTDGGNRWRVAGGLPEGTEVTSVAFDRRRPTTLFAGTTNRGVYRSTDAGVTWRPTERGGESRE